MSRSRKVLVVSGLLIITLTLGLVNFFKLQAVEPLKNSTNLVSRWPETKFVEKVPRVWGISKDLATDPATIDTSDQSDIQVNTQPSPTLAPVITLNMSSLLAQINNYRAANNQEPLNNNSTLNISAQNKLNSMLAGNYFSHANAFETIKASGYDYSYAGENLAIHFFSESAILNAWQNSSSHNATLLSANYRDAGLAYKCNVNLVEYSNTCIIVMHFGSLN